MPSPEHLTNPGSNTESLSGAASERSAELLKNLERESNESEHGSENIEDAQRAVEAKAISKEAHSHSEQDNANTVPSAPHHKDKQAIYNQTLERARTRMTKREKSFSKLIHQPTVERASAVVGSSIARPNALLFGAFFAFALSGIVYFIAHRMGYSLSGFESIGAFIIGWLLGLLVDLIRLLITGKR